MVVENASSGSASPQAGQVYNHNCCYLKVIEQPKSSMRFRYESEGGSHGRLTGQTDKSFPAVKLENYHGQFPVKVKVSLYTNEKMRRPHFHYLSECDSADLSTDGTATFRNLIVIYNKSQLDRGSLFKRIEEECKKMSLPKTAAKQKAKEILNSVILCFTASTWDAVTETENLVCGPVYSHPVINGNAVVCANLNITRISKCSSPASGGEEIFMLCDKVQKNNIQVRFFELDAYDNKIWEGSGTFAEADVHHQFAIVFKTPPYRKRDITEHHKVFLELCRPSDDKCSERKEFWYTPVNNDSEEIHRKRKKPTPCEEQVTRESIAPCECMSPSAAPIYDPTTIPVGLNGGVGNSYVNETSDTCAVPLTNEQLMKDVEALFGCLKETSCNPVFGSVNSPKFDDELDLSTVLDLPSTVLDFPSHLSFEIDAVPTASEYDVEGVRREFDKLSMSSGNRSHDAARHTNLSEEICVSLLFPNEDGDNLFHLLILHEKQKSKWITIFLKILNDRASPALNSRNKMQQTPLHLAVLENEPDVIQLLLCNGANPNLADRNGNTAFHLASKSRYACCLERLLCRGTLAQGTFKDSVNNDGFTALHCAVISGCQECVKLLIQSGADVNSQELKGGRSCLHLAAEYAPHLEEYLVSLASVNVNQQDYAGNTARHVACSSKADDALFSLMASKTEPSIENTNIETSVEQATAEIKGKNAQDLSDDDDELKWMSMSQILEVLPVAQPVREKTCERNEKSEDTSKIAKELTHTDSGYISSESSAFSERTMKRLCSLLDPPNDGWEQLGIYVLDETNVKNVAKLCKSPTETIINYFLENSGDMDALLGCLEMAGLTEARDVLQADC